MQYRPRLTEEEYNLVQRFREGKLNSETGSIDREPKPFVLSAWDDETGMMMDIKRYCEFYKLPFDNIISYKLVSHTGVPFYNVLFKESKLADDAVTFDEIKEVLNKELTRTYKPFLNPEHSRNREGVLKWSDLHFGAHIRNLLLTKDYDSSVLRYSLLKSVYEVNTHSFSRTHVHICGDLIESFSGLNHVNSWQSMNKDEIGSKAIMLCCELLDEVLRNVENLGEVKIVAGNHDRISKDNDEDVKGGAAELIAWGLKLKGYSVEFHPMIITHKVEGINHINLHGHMGISKKPTQEILWKFGEKGCFNFIFEGHLHTIIEKLTVSQREKYKTTKDDEIDHRRMHLPSFFTGNYYSETLGFTSNAGYVIVSDNGRGLPNLFMGAI